jgi:hypothetical protein
MVHEDRAVFMLEQYAEYGVLCPSDAVGGGSYGDQVLTKLLALLLGMARPV